jgi:hypothetical protein
MSFVNCTSEWCVLEDQGYSTACTMYEEGCDPCFLDSCITYEELQQVKRKSPANVSYCMYVIVSQDCWAWTCYPTPTPAPTPSPPTPSPAPLPPATGLFVGAIAAGVAVCLLLLAVFFTLLYYLRRQRQQQQQGQPQQLQQHQGNAACAGCMQWMSECRSRCFDAIPMSTLNNEAEVPLPAGHQLQVQAVIEANDGAAAEGNHGAAAEEEVGLLERGPSAASSTPPPSRSRSVSPDPFFPPEVPPTPATPQSSPDPWGFDVPLNV